MPFEINLEELESNNPDPNKPNYSKKALNQIKENEVKDDIVFSLESKKHYSDKSQYDTGLLPDEDYMEKRAQNQTVIDRVGNAAAYLVPNVALKATEGIVLTGSLVANGFNVSQAADSGLVQLLDGISEDLKAEMPIYKTKAYEDGNIFQQMGSASFWTDEFADGVAFALSSYVPGGALGKLGVGTKIATGFERGLNSFAKTLRASQAGWLSVPQLAKIANGIDKTAAFALMTSSEAMFEAKDARDAVRNELSQRLGKNYEELNPQEKAEIDAKAGETAAATFNMNMSALAPSNLLETSMLFKALGKGTTAASRAGSKFIEATEEGAQKIIKQEATTKIGKLASKIGNSKAGTFLSGFAKSGASEGLYEENIQQAIQTLGQRHGVEGDKDFTLSAIGELPEEMITNLTDKEGIKSIVLGALIGGPLGGISNVREENAEKAQAMKALDAINQSSNNFLKLSQLYVRRPVEKNEDGGFVEKEIKDADGSIRSVTMDGGLELDDNGKPIVNNAAVIDYAKNSLEIAQLNKDIEKAEDYGFRDTAQILRNERFSKWALSHYEAGLGDEFLQKLDTYANMKPEELADLGFQPYEVNEDGSRVEAKDIISRYKQQALKLEKLYNGIHGGLIDTTPNKARTAEAFKIGARAILLEDVLADIDKRRSDLSLNVSLSTGGMQGRTGSYGDVTETESAVNEIVEQVMPTINIQDAPRTKEVQGEIKDETETLKKTEVKEGRGESIYDRLRGDELKKLDKKAKQTRDALADLKKDYIRLTGVEGNKYFEEKRKESARQILEELRKAGENLAEEKEKDENFFTAYEGDVLEFEHNGKTRRGIIVKNENGTVEFEYSGTGGKVRVAKALVTKYRVVPQEEIQAEELARQAKETEAARLKEQRTRLETEIARIRDEGISLNAEIEQLKLDIEKEQAYYDTLSKNTSKTFRKERDKRKKEIRDRIHQLKAKVAELSEKRDTLRKEYRDLKAQLATLPTDEKEIVKQELSIKRRTIATFSRIIEELQQKLIDLRLQYMYLQDTIAAGKKEYESLLSDIDAMIAEEEKQLPKNYYKKKTRTVTSPAGKKRIQFITELKQYRTQTEREYKNFARDKAKQVEALTEEGRFVKIQIKNRKNHISKLEAQGKRLRGLMSELRGITAPKAEKSQVVKEPEIVEQHQESRKETIIEYIWEGAKKQTVFSTAGKAVRSIINSKKNIDITEFGYDENGNRVEQRLLNTRPDQQRFFNFTSETWNPATGNYKLKITDTHPEPTELGEDEKRFINTNRSDTDNFTLWAVVTENGVPVTRDGKQVYTTIHSTGYIASTGLSGENADAERIRFSQFRKETINNLSLGQEVSTPITGKSLGHINLIPVKNDGRRQSSTIRGRVLRKGESFNSLRDRIGISVIADNKNVVVMNDQTYEVPHAGKTYVLIDTPDGSKRPLDMVTRDLTHEETGLIVDLLRHATFIRNGRGAFDPQATIKIDGNNFKYPIFSTKEEGVGIVSTLINWGKNETNPKTQIYFDKDNAGNWVLRFGLDTELTIEQLHSEAGRELLRDWLKATKIHHVSKKLLEKDSAITVPLSIRDGKISRYEFFSKEEGGYLAYLFGDMRKTADEQGDKFIKRSGTRVLGTDLVKFEEQQFNQVNLYFGSTVIPSPNSPVPVEIAQTAETMGEVVQQLPDIGNMFTPSVPEIDDISSAYSHLDFDAMFAFSEARTEGKLPVTEETKPEQKEITDEDTKQEVPDIKVVPTDYTGIDLSDELNLMRLAVNGPRVLVDLAKEEAWFKERFPTVDFRTVKGLIEGKAWGMFHRNAVVLSDIAEEGTVYHEAFHVVSQMFLNKPERDKLYNEVRKRDGKAYTDLEAEETLAEDFREYVMSGGKKKFGAKAKSFFERLWNIIKEFILGESSAIDEVFERINAGAYKNAPTVGVSSLTLFKKVSGEINGEEYILSQAEIHDLMETITGLFFNELFMHGYSYDAVINRKINRGRVYDSIFQRFEAVVNKITSAGKTPPMAVLFAVSGGNNRKQIEEVHNQYMKQFRIELKDEDEIEESERGRGVDPDEFKPHIEFSSKHGMPQEIKLLIASVIEKNSEGKYVPNSLGLPKLVNFNKLWNKISQNLAGIADWPKMKAKLESLSATDPSVKGILDKLNSIANEKERVYIQTRFFQSFAKTKNDFITLLIDPDTGNIFNTPSDRSRIVDSIRTKWENNFKESNSVTLDMNAGKHVLAKDITKLSDAQFLSELGITFSNPDKALKDNRFTNNVQWLKKEVSKLIAAKKPIYNVFDKAMGMTGNLNKLLELEAEDNHDIFEMQHINPEGKTVYSITLNNYLSTVVNKINNADTWEELIRDVPNLDVTKNKYAKNSLWLKAIEKNFKSNKNKLILHILEGIRQDSVGEEGVVTSDLKMPDLAVQQINSVMAIKGDKPAPVYSYLPAADKKLEYGFGGLDAIGANFIEPSMVQYDSGRYIFKPEADIERIFLGYFRDELDRILRAHKGEGSDIKTYNSQAKNWTSFAPILGTDGIASIKAMTLDYTKDIAESAYRSLVTRKVEDYLNNLISDNISFAREQMIIGLNFENYGISKEIVSKYGNVQRILAAFTINDLIGSIEQVKLFTGDLAFYKDFYKRTSGLVGTGEVSRTDNEINEYIERTNKKFGTTKSIDGTFRVATFKDVEGRVQSAYADEYGKLLIASGMDEKEANSIVQTYKKKLNEADAQGYITLPEYRELLLRIGKWTSKHESAYERVMNNQPLEFTDLVKFTPLKPQYLGAMKDTFFHPGYLKLSLMPLLPNMVAGRQLETLLKRMSADNIGIAVFESGNKVGADKVQDFYSETGKVGVESVEIDGEMIEEDTNLKYSTYDYRYMKIQLDVQDHEDNKIIFGTQFRKLLFSNLFRNGTPIHGQIFNGKNAAQLLEEYTSIHSKLIAEERKTLFNELGLKEGQEYTYDDYTAIMKTLVRESIERGMPDNVIEGFAVDQYGQPVLPFDAMVGREKVENMLMSIINSRLIRQKMNGKAYVQGAVTGFESGPRDFSPQIKKSGELKFLRKENGEIKGAEVLIPLPREWREAGIKAIEDVKDKRLLELIGYRIPTQGLNSILHLQVVGFLPEEAGNLIIVPSEIVVQAGSDFDIDKLQVFRPNYYKDEGYLKYAEDNEKPKTLQNRLIEIIKSIISNPVSFPEQIRPNSADTLKSIATEIVDLKGKKESSALLEWKTKLDTRQKFLATKAGVGQTALHNTHHVMSQIANLYLRAEDIYFPHNKVNVDGKNYPSFAGTHDVNGKQPISAILAEFLTGYVDGAKDPFVFDLNAISLTANTFFFMTRLGAPIRWTSLFMNQPVIDEYLRMKQIYEAESVKSNPQLVKPENVLVNDILQVYKSYLKNNGADKFDPKVFTESELKSFVGKKTMSIEFAQAQVQIFEDFKRYMDYTKALQEAVQASSDDTKGAGKNLNEAQLRLDLKTKVRNENLIGNFDNLFTRTFIGGFENAGSKLALKMYKPLFVSEIDEVKEVMKSIKEDLKSTGLPDRALLKALDRVKNAILMYIISTKSTRLKISPDQIRKAFVNEYSNGKLINKSLANKILELKNKEGYKDNFLIRDILIPLISEDQNDVNNIKVFSKRVDTFTSNQITEAFEELMEIDPRLAENIIKIGVLQTGLDYNPISYLQFIPVKEFGKIAKEAIEAFKNSSSKGADMQFFPDQFYANNFMNRNIVPTVRGSNIKYVGGNLYVSGRFSERRFVKTYDKTRDKFYLWKLIGGDGTAGIFQEYHKQGRPNRVIEYYSVPMTAFKQNFTTTRPMPVISQDNSVSLTEKFYNTSPEQGEERKEQC